MASQELFYDLKNVQVHPPTEISNHCLISFDLSCYYQIDNEVDHEVWSPPGKFPWSEQNKDSFVDSLLLQANLDNIIYINNLLDDNSSNDVDHIVNKVNYIFIQAATISVKFKTNINNKRNKSKRKARPKKNWISNDCLLLRKEVRTLATN